MNLDANVLQPSIEDHTITAPLVYFFYITLADLFPVVSQLISMAIVMDDIKHSSRKSNKYDECSEDSDEYASFLREDNGSNKIQFVTTSRASSGNSGELVIKPFNKSTDE